MSRTIEIKNVLLALLLILGLVMLAWGGRAFATNQPPKARPADIEDVGDLSHDVIDSPTTGETIKGLVTGPAGRKMGALLVAIIGLALASGAALSLAPTRNQA
jgi:hypothetical protein